MASDEESGEWRLEAASALAAEEVTALETELRPQEFFRDVVVSAIERRGMEATQASEAYLVSLLAEHALRPGVSLELSEPFGLRLARAMHTSGGERFQKLRAIGDDVLFASGFFAQHLRRRGVELGYAAGLGQVAYGSLASMIRARSNDALPVFDELADNFGSFVGLLQHVSDTFAVADLGSDTSVLALYERWSETGSLVLSDALLGLGVVPTPSSGGLN